MGLYFAYGIRSCMTLFCVCDPCAYLFYYRSRENSAITKSFQRPRRVRTASEEPIQTVQVPTDDVQTQPEPIVTQTDQVPTVDVQIQPDSIDNHTVQVPTVDAQTQPEPIITQTAQVPPVVVITQPEPIVTQTDEVPTVDVQTQQQHIPQYTVGDNRRAGKIISVGFKPKQIDNTEPRILWNRLMGAWNGVTNTYEKFNHMMSFLEAGIIGADGGPVRGGYFGSCFGTVSCRAVHQTTNFSQRSGERWWKSRQNDGANN